MGVRIQAFGNATQLRGKHINEDDESLWDTHIKISEPEPGFEDSFAGLEAGKWYSSDETIEVLSTSYGSYNLFRSTLVNFRGVSQAEVFSRVVTDDPFDLLVNFSDCEGAIGAEACFILHLAFERFKDEYCSWAEANLAEYDARYFKKWYSAFDQGTKLASQNGFIFFS